MAGTNVTGAILNSGFYSQPASYLKTVESWNLNPEALSFEALGLLQALKNDSNTTDASNSITDLKKMLSGDVNQIDPAKAVEGLVQLVEMIGADKIKQAFEKLASGTTVLDEVAVFAPSDIVMARVKNVLGVKGDLEVLVKYAGNAILNATPPPPPIGAGKNTVPPVTEKKAVTQNSSATKRQKPVKKTFFEKDLESLQELATKQKSTLEAKLGSEKADAIAELNIQTTINNWEAISKNVSSDNKGGYSKMVILAHTENDGIKRIKEFKSGDSFLMSLTKEKSLATSRRISLYVAKPLRSKNIGKLGKRKWNITTYGPQALNSEDVDVLKIATSDKAEALFLVAKRKVGKAQDYEPEVEGYDLYWRGENKQIVNLGAIVMQSSVGRAGWVFSPGTKSNLRIVLPTGLSKHFKKILGKYFKQQAHDATQVFKARFAKAPKVAAEKKVKTVKPKKTKTQKVYTPSSAVSQITTQNVVSQDGIHKPKFKLSKTVKKGNNVFQIYHTPRRSVISDCGKIKETYLAVAKLEGKGRLLIEIGAKNDLGQLQSGRLVWKVSGKEEAIVLGAFTVNIEGFKDSYQKVSSTVTLPAGLDKTTVKVMTLFFNAHRRTNENVKVLTTKPEKTKKEFKPRSKVANAEDKSKTEGIELSEKSVEFKTGFIGWRKTWNVANFEGDVIASNEIDGSIEIAGLDKSTAEYFMTVDKRNDDSGLLESAMLYWKASDGNVLSLGQITVDSKSDSYGRRISTIGLPKRLDKTSKKVVKHFFKVNSVYTQKIKFRTAKTPK